MIFLPSKILACHKQVQYVDVKKSVYSRGVQKTKKLDFNWVEWFFPLHRMPGVTTKNFRPLNQLEDPALPMLNYTKEYSENSKENSESQYFGNF